MKNLPSKYLKHTFPHPWNSKKDKQNEKSVHTNTEASNFFSAILCSGRSVLVSFIYFYYFHVTFFNNLKCRLCLLFLSGLLFHVFMVCFFIFQFFSFRFLFELFDRSWWLFWCLSRRKNFDVERENLKFSFIKNPLSRPWNFLRNS